MNRRTNLDQLLTVWLDEEAGSGSPAYLDETLELLDRAPQRRWLGAFRRVVPMQLTMRRVIVPRPLVYLTLVAILVAALAVALLVVGSQQRRLPPPFGPAGNGLIAFDSGGTIYLARGDGSAQRPFEGGLKYDYSPAFSPDGTKIAFWSTDRPGARMRVFVGPADGSTAPIDISGNVSMTDLEFSRPAWSPDGTKVAFGGYLEGLDTIYLANADGSGVQPVTDESRQAQFPSWSPDGKWIAFRLRASDATALHIVTPDGSVERVLESVPGQQDAFTVNNEWSPDGTRLVYHRPGDAGPIVAVTDLDGNEAVVSQEGKLAVTPSWSTDGKMLAWMTEPEGLVVANADGTGHRVLGPIAGCAVWFSPDSKYVVGYAPDCFTDELVVVPLDDPGAVRTIQLQGNITGAPSWQRVAD